MTASAPSSTTPDHVPDHLVLPFSLVSGVTTDFDPFTQLVDPIHQGPAIFYALNGCHGSPAWVVRRAADLREIYFDTEHFSNKDFSPFARIIGESWSLLPAEMDPPTHRLYRAFVNPLFTPAAIKRLDDRIRTCAREYIAKFRHTGECEFMSDFAFEFPITIFLELMGLPLDQAKTFLEWETDLLHSGGDLDKIAAATRKVVDYLEAAIEERRADPKDDLISYGIETEFEGRRLTRNELIGFTFNLFVGGLDTVSSNMGLHFWHLATHPSNQELLRADPSRIPDAIEEMMRAYPAVTTFRTCSKQIEFKGVTFMPGDKISMSTTLAGRDPDEFDLPTQVRFDRKPRHVSFAYGPHICVGIHLARREMRVAMEEFLIQVPTFGLADGHITQFHLGVIQPVELPLRWQPGTV